MMGFELEFTHLFALLLALVILKIVFLAFLDLSDPLTDRETIASSVNEGSVAKQTVVDKGLRVRCTKVRRKRVKFVFDDVVTGRIDRYAGSENPGTVEEEKKDENSGERVGDQTEENGLSGDLGGETTKEQSYDDARDKRSSEIAMQIEKDGNGDELEKEKISASSGPASVVVEGSENPSTVEEKDGDSGEMVDDQTEENGLSQDLGGEIIEEQSYDDIQDKGSLEIEMHIEKDCNGDKLEGSYSEKDKTSARSGLASEVVEEEKKDKVFENDEVKIDQKEGNHEGVRGNDELIGGDKSIDGEDEDWEGIERSELEKVFAEAVNYMEYGFKKDKEDDQWAKVLGNDVQLQLYGLHKVAVEGPCHEPQPMALKLSARAKWNAWQKLGSMSQDEAMEQYIKLLSDGIPGWMQDYSADYGTEGSPKVEALEKMPEPDPEYERKSELTATPIGDSNMGNGSLKEG